MGTGYIQMTFSLRCNVIIVVILLSPSINTVGCTSSNVSVTRLSLQRKTSLVLQSSEISTVDLKSLLFALEENKAFDVDLIFDEKYQDKSRSLLETISNDASGSMSYQFNSSTETLNTLIRTGTPRTSVITLCTFENVLEMFRVINETRLKSHFVNWILIFEAEEAKREFLFGLQSLIFEGTKVTAIIEEQVGNFSIFAANVELDGIMRYKVVSPPDGAWGYPQPDGTITGMIGMVARREVNFAVTGIAMNFKRTPVIDYTAYYNMSFMTIFSRAPKLLNRAMAILSTFPLDVWIYLFLAVMFIGPVLKIQSAISQKSNESVPSWKLHVYSFNMFRNLIIQGNLLRTSHWPHRIIFFTWYTFCLIVAALYSGTLTAVLAVPSFEKAINYLDDLPEAVANGYYLTVIADSTNEYLFKEATGGILKQTWELFDHEDRSKGFLYDVELAFRLVLDEKSIHFSPVLNGDIVCRRLGLSKFHFGKERFYPQFDGFALPPGAPYKRDFDRVIQNLLKGGLIVKWKYDEIFKMGNEDIEDESSAIGAFNLSHLQGAFFVCLVGFVVATVVLVLEILFWNVYHSKIVE